jgi:hypothetical protein
MKLGLLAEFRRVSQSKEMNLFSQQKRLCHLLSSYVEDDSLHLGSKAQLSSSVDPLHPSYLLVAKYPVVLRFREKK